MVTTMNLQESKKSDILYIAQKIKENKLLFEVSEKEKKIISELSKYLYDNNHSPFLRNINDIMHGLISENKVDLISRGITISAAKLAEPKLNEIINIMNWHALENVKLKEKIDELEEENEELKETIEEFDHRLISPKIIFCNIL